MSLTEAVRVGKELWSISPEVLMPIGECLTAKPGRLGRALVLAACSRKPCDSGQYETCEERGYGCGHSSGHGAAVQAEHEPEHTGFCKKAGYTSAHEFVPQGCNTDEDYDAVHNWLGVE